MNTNEWALIIFTILMQLVVGSFLVLRVVHLWVARKSEKEANLLTDLATYTLVPLVGLALIASLFHLGNPINAPRAITNLGTSWLSREILFSVIFGLLVVFFALLQWRKIGSATVRSILGWITALLGLLVVYSMSRIYMLPTQPSWNTLATPISFFTTTLLMGTLTAGTFFIASRVIRLRKNPGAEEAESESSRNILQFLAVTSIILLGVELVVLPIYIGYLAITGSAGIGSVKLMIDSYSWAFVIRVILAIIGVGILGVFIYENTAHTGREKTYAYLAYSSFGFILVAEILGRFLFYVSRFRIGV